jgi:HEAT repeat protein
MCRDAHSPRTTWGQGRVRATLVLWALYVLCSALAAGAQEPTATQSISRAQLQAAIDKLGDLDYAIRTSASRTVRRASAADAVPALLQAAAGHADGYVRYRALVLLTGFNDPRVSDAMRSSLRSPNDRLRTVAYNFFEHNPDRDLTPQFLAALDSEQAEFVRPALVRALAAIAAVTEDARVRQTLVREVGRGEDFFRSAVVEAFGDFKARYAYDAVTAIAKLDGPLQGDAAMALGKMGDTRALETLAALQRSAPTHAQPSIAAAICLLGVNCDVHEHYLVETLKFSDKNAGFQELLRGAAAGMGALAVAGHADAAAGLVDIGVPSLDPTRAPVALALGTIALRNTPLTIAMLEKRPEPGAAIDLLAEGFDMLEEDLDKERFFAVVRRMYWDSAEGSPVRALMQRLIGTLDF